MLIEWNYKNITVPMIADSNKRLWTTLRVVCAALGITKDQMKKVVARYGDHLDLLRVSDWHLKDELNRHRDTFGIKRFRGDMIVVSDATMIKFAMRAPTQEGYEFVDGVVEQVQQAARIRMVDQLEHDELLARLAMYDADIREMKKELAEIAPLLKAVASASGKSLSAQRQIKKLYN